MNLDPHWLKERYKNKDSAVLSYDLRQLQFATPESGLIDEIQAELERREREST